MKKLPPIVWILLLALILRLISLNQSLWLDEGIQWWASSTFSLAHLVTEYIKGDFNPPLFHIILHFWLKIFPDTEFFLRLPSVLFSLGTVYFTYKLAELIIPKQKHFAAILTATAPLLIYYSQEARPYALAAFTITAAVYCFLKKHQLLSIIFLSLALYSHYLTWLLLPLFFFLQPVSTALSVLSFAPFLPVFLNQLQQGTTTATVNPIWAQVVGSLSVKNILLVPIKFLIGRLPIEANLFYALILLIPLSLSVYLIFKARNKLLYSWFFLPLFLGAIISLKIPVFAYFRFLFIVPAFYLLLSLGVSELKASYQKFAVIFLLALNLLTTSAYLLNPQFHRENWQAAVSYIHSQDPTSPVVIYSAVRSPFEYYDRGQSVQVSEQNLDQLINQPAAWYISYAQPIFDPEQKITTTLKQLGFEEMSQRHFRGVTIIRYQNPTAKLFSSILLQ